MSKRSFRSLFVLTAAVLALTGCNSKSSTGRDVTIDGTTYRIEADHLIVGMECDYAPFNWTDSDSNDHNFKISNAQGYADGYDVQIAHRLGEILGVDVEINKEVWDSLIIDCQSDSINMVLAGMTDTEEREQSIDFTSEYYRSEVVLLADKDVADSYEGKILEPDDLRTLLNGKNVVSQRDTVEDDMIDNFVRDYGANHAAAQNTYALAATDVSNGTADFLTVELPVAQNYVKNFTGVGIINMDQSVLGVDLSQLGVSIGIKKGNSGLKSALNAALAKISQEERNTLMTQAVERSSSN